MDCNYRVIFLVLCPGAFALCHRLGILIPLYIYTIATWKHSGRVSYAVGAKMGSHGTIGDCDPRISSTLVLVRLRPIG